MKTRNEQMAELNRLLATYDRRFAAAFLAGIEKIRSSVTLNQIAERLRVRDIQGVLDLFNQTLIAAGFVDISRTIQQAYIAGGDYGSRIAAANKIDFVFTVADSNSARFITEYQAQWIREISAEMRQNISLIAIEEVTAGTNPIESARRIRQGLGLTVNQEQAVQNYRGYLEELDKTALDRQLRDARFDPTVTRAIEQKKPLSKAQIDKMVNRYRERYIKRRSETIARTESMTLLQSGEDQYWRQAIADGQVLEDEVWADWIVTHDSKLRHSHAAIPSLNPEGRQLNDPFRSPLGMIRYPSDPAAAPANRINCRCALHRRIKRP